MVGACSLACVHVHCVRWLVACIHVRDARVHCVLCSASRTGCKWSACSSMQPLLRRHAVWLQGGESAALARLEASLRDAKWVTGFEKPSTDPSAFEKPATTVLSPYLKFGCLSPRLFHKRLVTVYKAAKGQHSKPPVSLRGQLLWREFFYTVRRGGWPDSMAVCCACCVHRCLC